MEENGIINRIEAEIAEHGSLRRFAQAIGFSASYISKVRRGHERASPQLARALGYEVIERQYVQPEHQ